MEQEPLFFEDVNDALKYAAHGAGYKDLASELFPEKAMTSPETAARYLSDCLNSNRSEKLDQQQVQLILRRAKEAGCHAAMNFIAGDAGYEQPVPRNAKDEALALDREIARSLKTVEHLLKRRAGVNG